MQAMTEMRVQHLNYLVRTYEGCTKLITATLQRLQTLPGVDMPSDFDPMLKGEKNSEGLETVKGRLSRAIEKELVHWDVWEQWLKHVPGIGPAIAGKLILLYYTKFTPICQECGGTLLKDDGKMTCQECEKTAKGDGVLKHRFDERDFPTVSKWWAFMGRHVVDGAMPKRAKGVVANWSTPGRTLGFHIGDQFNRQKEEHPYKKFFLERKRRHEVNHPEWTKGHIHNAARNETVKLFLSHFWVVTRTLAGKPITDPYSGVIMGHTNIIQPFYWEG